MIVKNKFLNYSNTFIYQDDTFFCFSLDSVLLSNFVSKITRNNKVVDLCSGNLPVPIILVKKFKCCVDAVEIQKKVCDLGEKTLECNGLDEFINILNLDIKSFKNLIDTNVYDIVTVNPPYFKYDGKRKINLTKEKAIARHEIKTNIEEIMNVSKCILKNGGKLFMINRTERLLEILEQASNNNLMPKRIRFIYKDIYSDSDLFLLECVKSGRNGMKIENPLYIYNNDEYTSEVIEMFGE